MVEIRKVTISGKEIEYHLERTRKKGLILKITNKGELLAKCSPTFQLYRIEAFLKEKSAWIEKMQKKISSNIMIERNRIYATDEDILLFGEKKSLIVSYDTIDKVDEYGSFIFLWTKDVTNCKKTNSLLRKYFQMELEKRITKYYDKYISNEPQLSCTDIVYKTMTKTRGMCAASSRRLTFNRMLYAFPDALIEYVVVHELMHILQQNHSPKYYEEVKKRMPDYKMREKELKKYVVI